MEKIDTDSEWGPVGIIPEEKSVLRISKSQEDHDTATTEPPGKPRCVGGMFLAVPD